jgi:hypothetical protein
MSRPELTEKTTAADFRAYYWLKEELVAFCRATGLSTAGSKQEITERIGRFLETGKREAPAISGTKSSGKMPDHFTRETVIGQNWRCSEPLRAFFSAEIEKPFKFNQVMRDFVKYGQGKTLGEALDTWEAANESPTHTEIAPQFEYNRHMRAYYEAHPDATREDAIKAWKQLRATRRNTE